MRQDLAISAHSLAKAGRYLLCKQLQFGQAVLPLTVTTAVHIYRFKPCRRNHKNTTRQELVIFLWQGRQFDNITFEDELDFDVSEIDQIFDDNDEETK